MLLNREIIIEVFTVLLQVEHDMTLGLKTAVQALYQVGKSKSSVLTCCWNRRALQHSRATSGNTFRLRCVIFRDAKVRFNLYLNSVLPRSVTLFGVSFLCPTSQGHWSRLGLTYTARYLGWI